MNGQPSQILVAEDNKIFAKAVCFNLENAGFATNLAFDGSEALQLAQQGQFDLVIADYQMPKLLGMDLCRRLHQDPRYANTPMILMSAFEDFKIVDLFDDLDLLEAIFVKPFNMSELVSRVRECLVDCPNDAITSW